jgi:hypothetical protein
LVKSHAKKLFPRGHPQVCGQVNQVCCEAGGGGAMSKNKTQKISVSTLVKSYYKFLIFNNLTFVERTRYKLYVTTVLHVLYGQMDTHTHTHSRRLGVHICVKLVVKICVLIFMFLGSCQKHTHTHTQIVNSRQLQAFSEFNLLVTSSQTFLTVSSKYSKSAKFLNYVIACLCYDFVLRSGDKT